MYRASDTATVGLPGICYAEEKEAALAYLDNPGYGGDSLWAVTLSPAAVLLDLEGWGDLEEYYGAEAIDLERAEGRASYPYEIVELLGPDPLSEAGWTHIRYEDSYPEDCTTIQCLTDVADQAEIEIEPEEERP